MKHLTKIRKDSSIKKWKEIIRLIKKYVVTNYYKYWKACGFCSASRTLSKHSNSINESKCNYCDLNTDYEDMKICNFNSVQWNYALSALDSANKGYFVYALKHAEIVLKYIKKAKVG